MIDLKKELLKLLKEDEEFRYTVIGLLGIEEVLKSIKSLQEQVAENTKAIKSLQEQVAKHSEILAKHGETLARHSETIESLVKRMEKLEGIIAGLGRRYGMYTEEAFRNAIRFLVEDLLKTYKVERWTYYDDQGIVFKRPAVVEVDVFVRDSEHILVEYKADIDREDVSELSRLGDLYERVTGVKPKLLIVGPTIDRKALDLAQKLGVEVRTSHILD